MFTLAGILLLVIGASLTFAVDRPVDGVDLLLVGWIVMAGGGLSLMVAMIRAAATSDLADDDEYEGYGYEDDEAPDSFDGPDDRQLHGRRLDGPVVDDPVMGRPERRDDDRWAA